MGGFFFLFFSFLETVSRQGEGGFVHYLKVLNPVETREKVLASENRVVVLVFIVAIFSS